MRCIGQYDEMTAVCMQLVDRCLSLALFIDTPSTQSLYFSLSIAALTVISVNEVVQIFVKLVCLVRRLLETLHSMEKRATSGGGELTTP